MAEFFDRIFERSASAISSIKTRSAVNPMLWLAGLVAIPCFALAAATDDDWKAIVFLIVGILAVLAPIVGYFVLMKVNPAMLRSEDFQIRQHAMEQLGEKGALFNPDASDITAIANPHVKALPPGDKGGDQ